jgi:hypothetical protein
LECEFRKKRKRERGKTFHYIHNIFPTAAPANWATFYKNALVLLEGEHELHQDWASVT